VAEMLNLTVMTFQIHIRKSKKYSFNK